MTGFVKQLRSAAIQLVSYEGIATGPPAPLDANSITDDNLPDVADYVGLIVVIKSGMYNGESRQIMLSTTGGKIVVDDPGGAGGLSFSGIIVSGTSFVISGAKAAF